MVLSSVISLHEILNYLVCSEHIKVPLQLNGNYEISCFECKKNFPILENKPVKIDFTHGFVSGLLKNSRRDPNPQKWTNWRKENLKFLKSRNIETSKLGLDIGAGDSLFHAQLKLDKIVSVDFTNYESTNLICDLNFRIPLASEAFDYILMTNLLEHLFDTLVLKEAYRLLKNNSYLYITVPFLLGVHSDPYDYHRYTHLYLKKILDQEGFETELISPSGDFGTFETLVEHYYRFPIHNGNLIARVIWQVQKLINFLLKSLVPVNFRMEYTGGYMIVARKTLVTNRKN